jgi:uncharacterized RDD family membrane protein YckC
MTAWWYADKDEKIGPIGIDELKQLIKSDKIDAKTMLWHEGMDAWRPLDQVEELNELEAVVSPSLPPKADTDTLSYPMANRWLRFFARIFDMCWETMLVAFILGAVFTRYSANFVEWFYESGASRQLFGLLYLPIAFILDALLYRAIGNTPGKALLGLKVKTLDGKSLSFAQYLNRNFSMWVSGLALGFPLFTLFTLVHQAGRLGEGQQASYDESTGFCVHSKPVDWWRKTAFGFAFVSLFVIIVALNTMEQTAHVKPY